MQELWLELRGYFSTDFFDFACDIHRTIAVHLDNCVCNVEKCTGTSGNQKRRNSGKCIQLLCPFEKWSDRFLFTGDDFLHERIPHHEVGGRSIFIQKKNFASGFHSLDNAGSLRRTSTGIFRIKGMGILVVRQIIDKERNVCVFDASTVLGTDLYCVISGDHIFSSVSRNMVIDTQFERFKQSGFAVITAHQRSA